MREKPRLLKRLDHIAPMTPISESGNNTPPRKHKPKVKLLKVRTPPEPEQVDYDYDYVHYAPYHDQAPFRDHMTPKWEHKDVHDVVNRYLMASQYGPPPEPLSGPKACACCQDMNMENRKRKGPTYNANLEPLIKDPGMVMRSPRATLEPLTNHRHANNDWRTESPELESKSRHLLIDQSWMGADPQLSHLDPIQGVTPLPITEGLNTTDPGPLYPINSAADIFPRHPQRAPRNRTPSQPARTLPSLPLTKPGGLFEPDRPLDPKDYRQMHLTKERRGEVLAAGGYNSQYMEHTPRGEITDDVVAASSNYHRAMEKLCRQINGLKVPNEKTMMDQL